MNPDVLNILYFLYLELTGSTEDAYFMLEHGAMYLVRLVLLATNKSPTLPGRKTK